jgi:acetyl esterase/lipase
VDPSLFPTLDPELAPMLSVLPDLSEGMEDIAAARELMALMIPSGATEGEEQLSVTDVTHEGVGLRVYEPADPHDGVGVLYLHGGGFCLGSVDSEHAGAVQLALALNVVVVSVEYRLAPEHPYPAGLDDCMAGLRYLGTMADRIAVHGQSAGGGLAAATVLRARDEGGSKVVFQSLGMPELDDRLETPSMQAFVATPLWSRPQAIKSWEYYLGGKPADGYAAPARHEDLSGLPPAHVTVMELDPLRDEGIAYATRMLQAGVSVELHAYPGTFHGSSLVVEAAVSKRQTADLLGALRRGLRLP